MDRGLFAASLAAIVLSLGCGHAVRDSVKTSGEAAERAAQESDRSRSALVLAEDARNAARDAAEAATDPPLNRRGDFLEDRADDAEDRAEDAENRAEDAEDRAEDLLDRAKDAEEAADRASEWMADKGFYTSETYWDCARYGGHEAFEDQPRACEHANEARALAEVVRWRAARAQTVADHARALADEARGLARLAEAERRSGNRRESARAEGERLRARASGKLTEVQAAYAEQDEDWRQLQARAGGWVEGAERTYAALKEEDDGGGWLGALVGGAVGAAMGATGASALGLTGSEVTDMVTLSTVAGAEIGGGGDGSATLAVAEHMNAAAGTPTGAVAGPQSTTAAPAGMDPALAGMDPALQGTFESLEARLTMIAHMSDADGASRRAFDAEARLSDAREQESAALQTLATAEAREAESLRRLESARDAADQAARQEADILRALEGLDRAFETAADERLAERAADAGARGATRPVFDRESQLFDARDTETAVARAVDAALEREATARRAVESARAVVDETAGREAAILQALEAVDRAFAAESTPSPADNATESADYDVGGIREEVFAALDAAFARDVRAAGGTGAATGREGGAAPVELAGSPGARAPVTPEFVFAEAPAASPALPPTPGLAGMGEWVRAVQAQVDAVEAAAGGAEAAAAGTGTWFSRTASCVDARDNLTRALERVEGFTVGSARPAFVTETAGAEALAELTPRLEAARERSRLACDSIERPW